MRDVAAPTAPIVLERVGVVRCAAQDVDDVPSEGLAADVVLDARFAPALAGIEPGDHLYVLALFDRADPRQLTGSTATEHEQGAFSIRSSSRPNRLGMTLAAVTAIEGATLSFEWLDFADGSPVIDLKRYNWRWECVLSARRLDRRHFERQADRAALALVLERPAANFHGERCAWVRRAAELGARLIHDHDVWLSDPGLRVHVEGSAHLVDALQGITGATLGNGRLTLGALSEDGSAGVTLGGAVRLVAGWDDAAWHVSA